MAALNIQNITKRFAQTRALDDLSLDVASGEFFTLLGPSGCGKTTLLRTIAGFSQQDSGEVRIDNSSIDNLPAYKRDTGMVFQDYAIFPHMSVADNVAFGLKNRRVPNADIRTRVTRALESVQLTGYEARMPHELSGGQQQRVGLARAMVIEPKILLMDEPLSNLDAKLRVELREDIRDIQRELGITTVYVTHDQEEALVVSDHICVMKDGHVEQIGSPWEVYRTPATRFVASFIGSMNFLETPPAQSSFEGSIDKIEGDLAAFIQGVGSGAGAVAAIRPEDVYIAETGSKTSPNQGDGVLRFRAAIKKVSFTGRDAQYSLQTADGASLAAHVKHPTEATLRGLGNEVDIELPASAIAMFDIGSGQRR